MAERSLGFVLAEDGPVVVTDEAGGQTRLAPGEALFVPRDARQRRAGGTAGSTYYGLELVVAPDVVADYSLGSASLLYAGDAFAAPPGRRDLDLVRDVVAADETSVLPDTGAPTLLLATSGGVRVRTTAGEAVSLRAGEATALAGALDVATSGLGSATYVAALIGPAVEPDEAVAVDPAADGGEVGTFAVTTYACPEGATIARFDPDACVPAAESLVAWSLASERFAAPLTSADAAVVGPTTTWTGLPAGRYLVALVADGFAPGYADYFVPSSDQVTRQGPATTQIFYDAARSTGAFRAYVFTAATSPPGPAAVVLRAESCPPGTSLPEIQVVACTPTIPGYDAILSGGDLAAPLTLGDATYADGEPRWGGLPYGDYELTFAALPDGHDTAYVFASPDQGTAVLRLGDPAAGFAFTLAPDTVDEDGTIVLRAFFVDGTGS